MFQLYLLLRLKNFGRIVIELGIFRIVFLTILTVAAIMILFLAENRFAIPVVCVLLLAGYHNVRKDKEFLRTLTPHLSVFLIKEYTLIALPFAGIEIIKGQFTDAIGLWLFAALLPCLKKIKLKHKPVRLPFLYKGSYEYIRIFRQSFWVYILLFLFATAGTVHGNIKINKVCLILWGLVQASGYLQTMDNRYLLHFKNFKTLCLFQLKSIAWNVFITSIPFSLALIASTYDQDEILFFLSYYTATLIYAIGIGMLRHIIPSPLLLFILQLSILMPFYLGSLFVPIILIPGITYSIADLPCAQTLKKIIMIEVNDLHKSFGKVKVLNGIHLEYHPGKIYGLVGENGAGKTTLFNCIMGIYDYTGSITKSKTLKTGYLSASNFFYSQITGLEHLEFCMKAKDLPVNTPTIQHLNEIFQLPLDRYAAEYSTGMKKKLGFMALLLQDNDVFILDEPFNGVDLKGCILMKRLIRQLKAKEKTVIISSHLIASLREICDIIHYLNEGGIYKEYHEETTEEIEEDILCNTKKIQPTSYFQ